MDVSIRVVRETLSDGSHVFNVRVAALKIALDMLRDEGYLTLHAYTERDARELSAQLCSAINVHSVDTVHITSDNWEE